MIDLPLIILIVIAVIAVVAFVIAGILRTVVPPNKIDIVVRRDSTKIYCPNAEYYPEGESAKSVYYHIPAWFPGFGMYVRRLPLEMLEIKVPNFVAFDERRARFECDIVAFCVIRDGIIASMRMPQEPDGLSNQMKQVLWATMRDSTTKMTVRRIINNRADIIGMIKPILSEALDEWGLGLKDIEIIEFKDAPDSHVVSDISSIREQEIETEARQKNADQKMKARMVEAESEEKARIKEIRKEEEIAKREQDKLKLIAKQEKEAREEELEVTRVNQVKQQKIDKQQAEVLAEQEREVAKIDAMKQKEVEAVIKEQKLLEGQGDKLRRQEQAKGEAAPIREKGTAEADVVKLKLLAEAKGKDELQKALNKFGTMAIEAMTAIREIEKNETVGVAGADALKYADVKAFLGGSEGTRAGWEVGKSLESLLVSNPSAGISVLNRTSQPNDLGFKKFDYGKMIAVIEKTPELKQQIRDALDKAEKEEERKEKEEKKEEKPKSKDTTLEDWVSSVKKIGKSKEEESKKEVKKTKRGRL